jgi:SP family general alpha glucoside:H+ symporter-like MFS transporter
LAFLTGLIFIPFFAQNIETLLVGDVLMGLPWGVFQTLAPAYAAEVTPVVLRPYLTTYVNMNWGFGQLLSSGVLRALLSREDEWAYRIPFAMQWMWPVPLIVAIAFAPESPWWLVRRGRNEDAKKSLQALTSAMSDEELNQTVSMMRHTNEVEIEIEIEKQMEAGTSYLDCFKGVNLRRTEITIVSWVVQAACGASLIGYSAYFFRQAGLPTTISFDFSMAVYAAAIAGVFISWFAMAHFGRRTIYLAGLGAIFLTMLSIGGAGLAENRPSSFAIGSLLLVFTLIYDITVGSLAYSIVTEMPSSRLRTKTIVLARSTYNCQGIINGVITPYMLNPGAWNWSGRTGFFWAGTSFLCLTWTFFRLPEPAGRTFAEMDVLFEQKVSARKFEETDVNLFQGSQVTNGSDDRKSETDVKA